MNNSIRDDIKNLQDEYEDISGNIETYRDMMNKLDKEINPKFKKLLNNVNQELNNKKVKVRNDQYKERQKIYDEKIKKIYDDDTYDKKEYYTSRNNICKVPYFIEKKELDHKPQKKQPYDIYIAKIIAEIANSKDHDLINSLMNSHNTTFEDLSGRFINIINHNKDYYGIKKKNNIDKIDLENIYINNTIEKMLIDKKSGITHANQFNNRIKEGIKDAPSNVYNAPGNAYKYLKKIMKKNNNNDNTTATHDTPDTSNNNTITGGGIYSINEICKNKLVSVLTVKDARLDLIDLKMNIINYIEYIKDIRIQFNKKYRELVQEKMKNLNKRKSLIKQLKKFSKGGYLKTKKSKTKKFRSKKNKKTKKIN